ncbi:hypothetical protein [Aquisediminimonas sediminicola]|uniref:hypothetical protein n=1 Tax=Alteraquisediminimonas sediminicola TaxID=2676787 RepID=UPI001C8EAE48|nr:hypothetical protein [Aquisediminimonas sediminicola]
MYEIPIENELLDMADRLCTVVGMIMEDHHSLAVASSRTDAEARHQDIEQLATAVQNMATLIAAAKVLTQLGG